MNISQEILSDITVHLKYSKYLPELQKRESWEELVDRNKAMHLKKYPNMQAEIDWAYEFVYDKKVLPSMRSLQFGGKSIEISPNRVYNCAYLPIDDIHAFSETMFLLLGGTGVGFSVQKHHVEKLPEIRKPNPKKHTRFLIGDSIEGWADAVKALIKSYFRGGSSINFDFSDIRPKGAMLVTSGGKAPGPQPLKECLLMLDGILSQKEDGDKLSSIEVHDMVCHIADAVLAGGIRRAALVSLFSADDEDMISCKTGQWWELNPQRGRANNSAVLLRNRLTKEFFMDLWKKIENSGSGEPGIFLSNDKDLGSNPCMEIALRPYQFCNLCEVNVSDVVDQEDLNDRVNAAAIIGTLQAGYTNFHYLRPIWQKTTEKEALIGVGMTGIGSGVAQKLDLKKAALIVKETNAAVAKAIGINAAARCTTIKPSGCMIPETEIITNKGILSLEDIFKINGYDLSDFKNNEKLFLEVTEDIKVKDLNDEWQQINKLYINGVEETFDVEFEDGLVVTVTANHRFLTKNRGWVRADELKDDDDIINY